MPLQSRTAITTTTRATRQPKRMSKRCLCPSTNDRNLLTRFSTTSTCILSTASTSRLFRKLATTLFVLRGRPLYRSKESLTRMLRCTVGKAMRVEAENYDRRRHLAIVLGALCASKHCVTTRSAAPPCPVARQTEALHQTGLCPSSVDPCRAHPSRARTGQVVLRSLHDLVVSVGEALVSRTCVTGAHP